MSRTGPLVKSLADGVKDDLGEIAADMETLRQKVVTLGESAAAINGLGAECNGWSAHLRTLIEGVTKEQKEVPAKLLGQAIHPIAQSVNSEHVEAVSAARRKAS